MLPTKYDYGCGKKHPLDLMTFYKSDLNNELVEKVIDNEYAISKPLRNQEPYMRLFVRDPAKKEAAQAAFKRLCG